MYSFCWEDHVGQRFPPGAREQCLPMGHKGESSGLWIEIDGSDTVHIK